MKPLAQHGTHARACGRRASGISPCRCQPCRAAKARYEKRLRFDAARGNPRVIDAGPVAEHLRTLRAAGTPWDRICEAGRLSTNSAWKLMTGRQAVILASTAARIFAITPVQGPTAPVAALGSVRRLRALYALGHGPATIVGACGLSRPFVCRLVAGQLDRVTADTAAKIAQAYRVLSMWVGSDARCRNRAARDAWAPPLAWEDNLLDDPDATPCDWRPRSDDRRGLRSAVVVEESRFLIEDAGLNRNAVADLLGLTREGLDRALSRSGHTELGRAA